MCLLKRGKESEERAQWKPKTTGYTVGHDKDVLCYFLSTYNDDRVLITEVL